MMNVQLLGSYLTEYRAVSNQEEGFSKFIINKLAPYHPTFTNDRLGNLYFEFSTPNTTTKKIVSKPRRVCICAHIDEPGLLVSAINKNGMILFIKQGNFRIFNMINGRVRIVSAKNKELIGVIQYCQKALSSATELNSTKNYFVDFGFKNKKEAVEEHGIIPGQTIDFFSNTTTLLGSRLLAKNLNNRVSVFAVIENIQAVIAAAKKNKVHLIVAFLVQRQIGNRGAYVVPANSAADLYLNLDGFVSGETVDSTAANSSLNNFRIGSGPCILVADRGYITKKKVQAFLEEVADSHKIKYQYAFTAETSNCGALSMATNGQLIMPIGFPYRYGLGPSQVIDFKDISEYQKYITAIIASLTVAKIAELQNLYS